MQVVETTENITTAVAAEPSISDGDNVTDRNDHNDSDGDGLYGAECTYRYDQILKFPHH